MISQIHLYRQVEVNAGMVRGWNCRLVCNSENSDLQTYKKKEKKRRAKQHKKTTGTMEDRLIYEVLLINYELSWRKKRKKVETLLNR